MKKTKKILSFFLALLCVINIVPVTIVEAAEYWPEGTEVNSQSAIVMEQSTGTVLYAKNVDDQHYPASITKILTALIAIENSSLDEVVTFSKDAVYETAGGSSISRDVGEEMTMEQCLYGMMLASANECAYAIAEHVGGTYDTFIQMMNDKATELGCTNSHFNNPHGLPDENHYTTAHDMALIAQAAFANETFRIICGTKTYTIPFTNKHTTEETYLQNHHKMLYPWRSTGEYLYDYCVGGKTGYTSVAGNTLVTFAEKDGMTLICVVLQSDSSCHFTDTRSLFDYCYDNFQVCNVAQEVSNSEETTKKSGITGSVEGFAKIDPEAVIVLPKTAEFSEVQSDISYANADDKIIATLEYTFADRQVGSADLLVSDTEIGGFQFAKGNGIVEEEAQQEDAVEETKVTEINLRIVLQILGIIVLILIVIFALIKATGNLNMLRRKFHRDRGPRYKKIKRPRNRRRR